VKGRIASWIFRKGIGFFLQTPANASVQPGGSSLDLTTLPSLETFLLRPKKFL
jgi:hypothetical protein